MIQRHNILTDDGFYHSKMVATIERHYGIKNFKKECQNKDSEFYGQDIILKDIYQTFILVCDCFFSDSNIGIEKQADEARKVIEKLIYKNETTQKHKHSTKAIKGLCDKRAIRLYNLMITFRNDELIDIIINKTKILDRLLKEMKALEKVGFDDIVVENIQYNKTNSKYYKKYGRYISKFDEIYSKRDECIEQYKNYFLREFGVEISNNDMPNIIGIHKLTAYANNVIIRVITKQKEIHFNITERTSPRELYKMYLQTINIDFDKIKTFEINSQVFSVVLYKICSLCGNRYSINDIINNFDMFYFLIEMKVVVDFIQDKNNKDCIINTSPKLKTICNDLIKVYELIQANNTDIENTNIDVAISKYYLPAYAIIKDVINRNKNFFERIS